MKLGRYWGKAARKLRLEKSKKSDVEVAKSLGDMKIVDYLEFEKGLPPSEGGAEIEIKDDAVGTLAEAVGVTAGELAEAQEAERAADELVTEEAKKKAAEDAKLKKGSSATDDDIKKAKKENGSPTILFSQFEKSSSQTEKDELDDEISKTSRREKISTIAKAVIGESAYETLRKGNILVPGELSPSGTLTAAQSGMLISLMVDQSDFLKKIQVKRMRSTKQDVNVWDLYGRKATRQTPGFWPTADTYMSSVVNKSLTMNANRINIMATFTEDMLRAYQNDLPTYESDIVNGLVMQMTNEIVDLGFNGLADTSGTSETTWTNLAKGWYKRSQESAPGAQVIDVSTVGTLDTEKKKYDAIIAACRANNIRFFGTDTPLAVSGVSFDSRELEILTNAYAVAYEFSGAPKVYRSRPLEVVNYLATNQMIHSQMKNYVLGIVGGDSEGISMEAHDVPQGKLIYVTAYVDYEMVNYDAVGIVQP